MAASACDRLWYTRLTCAPACLAHAQAPRGAARLRVAPLPSGVLSPALLISSASVQVVCSVSSVCQDAFIVLGRLQCGALQLLLTIRSMKGYTIGALMHNHVSPWLLKEVSCLACRYIMVA